mmetsp:Transcript_41993/g.67510  ORF Transcript_41993/g.67510 Transcript_41993/m.67510 type:complete len:253 (-) Transcript_41993:3335-4093(-)
MLPTPLLASLFLREERESDRLSSFFAEDFTAAGFFEDKLGMAMKGKVGGLGTCCARPWSRDTDADTRLLIPSSSRVADSSITEPTWPHSNGQTSCMVRPPMNSSLIAVITSPSSSSASISTALSVMILATRSPLFSNTTSNPGRATLGHAPISRRTTADSRVLEPSAVLRVIESSTSVSRHPDILSKAKNGGNPTMSSSSTCVTTSPICRSEKAALESFLNPVILSPSGSPVNSMPTSPRLEYSCRSTGRAL